MISCFLQDRSLHSRTAGTFTDDEPDSGYGYVTDKLKSYFKTPTTIEDSRDNRLDLGGGEISTYPLKFTFDGEFNNETVDLDLLAADEYKQLFNVIEALVYFSDLDDSAMETLLLGSSVDFGVYEPSTFSRSVSVGTPTFYTDGVVAGVVKNVRNWISFTANLSGGQVTFKIWIGNESFLADYPHTYFVKVVYPGDPAKLLTGNYQGVIDAISDLSEYNADESTDPVGLQDNSGLYEFSSAYFPNGTTLTDRVSIVVFYKGAVPSTQEVRVFIRDELLARNIAAESVWREVLPDLFVDGRFFLVPAWDHYVALPTSDLPKGIVPLTKVEEVLAAVYPSQDINWLKQRAETLVSASSEFVIIAVPDSGNDANAMSLVAEHPTYVPVDASVPYFANMEIKTQQFSISLASAMAVLVGAQNNHLFTEDVFDGRTYLSFVADLKEYHVLKPDSYPDVV